MAIYNFTEPDENKPTKKTKLNHDATASPPERRLEREFGVPVPGEIQPMANWTNTSLKSLPNDEHVDFKTLFGREAPIMLDIGCGNGRSTLSSAVWRPQFDHLASDNLPVVIRYATRRANQRGLTNVRFTVIGGRELLAHHIAPQSITEIHVYHPQPYYDPKLIHKRLITPEFVSLVHQALIPGGLFVIQTDNPAYWNYMRKVIPLFFEFEEHPGKWPDAPKGRTRREIIALKEGLPVFRGVGRPRSDITIEEARRLADSLPAPRFNADRKLMALDEMEKESGARKNKPRPRNKKP